MVDRVEKFDPNLYRVQRAGEDRRQKQDQQDDPRKKKEKDKFEKKKAGWKRLIPGATAVRTNPLLAGRPAPLPHAAAGGAPLEEAEEESSLTFSERVLVLWGILDGAGRPRVPVIFTYLIVMGLITVGTILIGIFVWH